MVIMYDSYIVHITSIYFSLYVLFLKFLITAKKSHGFESLTTSFKTMSRSHVPLQVKLKVYSYSCTVLVNLNILKSYFASTKTNLTCDYL